MSMNSANAHTLSHSGKWIEYYKVITSIIPTISNVKIFRLCRVQFAIQLILIRLTLNFLMTSSSSSSSVNSGMLPRPPALSDRRSGKSSTLMARSSSFGTSFIPKCSAPRAHLIEGIRDDILSDALLADAAAVNSTQVIAVTLILAVSCRDAPQRNVPNEGRLGFFGDFRQICRHISKTVHFRHKVTMGR